MFVSTIHLTHNLPLPTIRVHPTKAMSHKVLKVCPWKQWSLDWSSWQAENG